MASALTERYDDRISGVLSCHDRVVVTGTLPTVCYAEGMTRFLYACQIRISGYPEFAGTLRDEVREAAASLASEAGVAIEHVAKSHVCKEAIVAKVLARRGDHPGLVHVISAMEACDAYKPWHDKQTHKTYLRPDSGKCLHYYFYFMDAELGLIYLRVPIYCPFRLQFYCNGDSWLTQRLAAEGIGFTMADNAFVRIDDWQRAQELADAFSPDRLHRVLDRYAAQCCPVLDVFGQTYHRSLMQVEYTPPLAQELGSQFSTRIEGTCSKHRFGAASIKMYDKFGQILRIETTTNDVSFFKHHRKVEHRQDPPTRGLAPVKKSIYRLIDLREILFGCNRRYLEHLSALDDLSAGVRALDRLTKQRRVDNKTVKGINLFDAVDNALLHALQDPRVNVAGIRRADLLPLLDHISPPRLPRQLRRLHDIGVIKRVAGTYRYYLTRIGRSATAALCHVTQGVLIPDPI